MQCYLSCPWSWNIWLISYPTQRFNSWPCSEHIVLWIKSIKIYSHKGFDTKFSNSYKLQLIPEDIQWEKHRKSDYNDQDEDIRPSKLVYYRKSSFKKFTNLIEFFSHVSSAYFLEYPLFLSCNCLGFFLPYIRSFLLFIFFSSQLVIWLI